MKHLLTTSGPACVIGAFLAALVIDFLLRFLVRGLIRGRKLEQFIRELQKIRNTAGGVVTDLDAIGKASVAGALDHLWLEYVKTLHPQREPDESGQNRVVRWRATALAETFFTDQALVDLPLRGDYFKHLPGILTGLGIIGTFSGLIGGLAGFQGFSNPAGAVQASVRYSAL